MHSLPSIRTWSSRAAMLLASLIVAWPVAVARGEFKVGLVLDRGGKDDKSFNSSAYEGATRAKNKLGISLKYVESPDDNAFEPMLRAFALREFDLIIGIGFAQKEAIQKVAAQFPQRHFAIVDAQVQAPNVRSLMFQEHEGAYVVGAIAALTSKTGRIGFVGGIELPPIKAAYDGWVRGAQAVNPKVEARQIYLNSFDDAAAGREAALALIRVGADMLHHNADAAALGLFQAVKETPGVYAFGANSDQTQLAPDRVLGSAIIAGAGLFVIWREHQLALALKTAAVVLPAAPGAATTPRMP